MQNYEDESELQFINFDFLSGGILSFFSRYFVFLVHISLRSSLLPIFSSYSKILKQASGHDPENAIF